MKQLKIVLFLFLFPFLIFAEEIELPIHNGWQFRQANTEVWMPAKVPGTVHTDLLENRKIEDPYFSKNEQNQRWIEKEDWEYKTNFQVNSDIITKDKILLDFKGLDTYANVYLNDSLILKADNMFRSWQVDVEGIIRTGENELRIYFHSPVKETEQIIDKIGAHKEINSDELSGEEYSYFSRKAAFHFGLGEGPRFMTSGIWQPIAVRAWDIAIIEDCTLIQKSLDEQSAKMIMQLKYHAAHPLIGDLEVLVDGKSIKKSTVELLHGIQEDNLVFTIENPELWWPNGMGDQKLYDVEILLKKDGKLIDSKKIKTGLRTIELIHENDRNGTGFYIRVNGKTIYIKGANYIPQDNFLPRVDEEKYRNLIQSVTDANMNLIRVWGGGIYENDIFYQQCDEQGILVWQDFMISTALYPFDDASLENIRLEAFENVKRLQHHPCMTIWCANSNVYSTRNKQINSAGKQIKFWTNYKDSLKLLESSKYIFKEMLPTAVKAAGQGVPFWESSPADDPGPFYDANSENPAFLGEGLNHQLLDYYRKSNSKLLSEVGVQSFPGLSTIKAFSKEEDWDVFSDVMKAHRQSEASSKSVQPFMSQVFKDPKDFESYLYLSQLLQAEAAKVTIEAHRVLKPKNMGSILWQLNDSWPAISWSTIDYDGSWKAAHYYVKRAFEQTVVAFEINNDELKLHGVTDLYEDLRADLTVELLDFNGKKLFAAEKKIRLKANSSEVTWKELIKVLLRKQKKEEVYIRARVTNSNQLLAENTFIFVPYKELKLDKSDIKYEFIDEEGKLFLELKSDKVAIGVYFDAGELDLKYSDNYFTLHAKETKRVEIKGQYETFEVKNKLTVKSLTDNCIP